MIRPLALFVTLTACAMTAVAAWDRGGTIIDRALLVSMCVVIVLAVHLIPALSRRPVAWLVWSVCLLCAVYGHLTFLTHASLRAAEAHAQQSALAIGTERQIQSAREALDEIKARPVATVAAQLAQEGDRRMRAALRAELAEGKRAENLRDDLAQFEAVYTAVRVTGATDPVTERLAVVTGWTVSGVSVVIGMTFAMLLELIGTLLWFEALRPSKAAAEPTQGDDTKAVTDPITEQVTAVTAAILAQECRLSVTSIREFLGYGHRVRWINSPPAGTQMVNQGETVTVVDIGKAGMLNCTRKIDGGQVLVFPWDLKLPA